LWTDEQLQCTPQGQAMLLPEEKSCYDWNIQRAEHLAAERQEWHQTATPDAIREKIRTTAAIRPLDEVPVLQVHKTGSMQRDGYRIDKLLLQAEPGLFVPALAYVPAAADGRTPAQLYLHEDGHAAGTGPEGPIAQWVEAGNIVLAADLPGAGETRASQGDRGQLGDWKNSYLAYLNGRSLVGLRAELVLAAARLLAHYESPETPRSVHLTAVGELGVPALHAVALEPSLFASATFRRTLISWDHVVRTPQGKNQIVNLVHNALAVYDLPDLIRLAGPDRIQLETPVDANGDVVEQHPLP
jgi:hypothetical protein